MQHWIDRKDDKAQLIVLTDEAVYAESLTPAAAAQAVEALEAGRSPAMVLGKDAKHVTFRSMTRVQYNEHETDIEFHHRDGKDDANVSVFIETPGLREQVFAAAQQQLSDTFAAYETHYSRWRAAFGPLIALTVFGLGTLALRVAAIAIRAVDEVEVSGRRQGLKTLFVWVLDTLGPMGVSVAGGLLVLLSGWVLYSRLQEPQRLHILQSAPYSPPSAVTLVLKYVVLVAVWALALRVIL
jgi:hypothetical protein